MSVPVALFSGDSRFFLKRSLPRGVTACSLLLLGASMGKEAGYPV